MCVVAMGGAVSLSAGQLLELVVRGLWFEGGKKKKQHLAASDGLLSPLVTSFFLTSLSTLCHFLLFQVFLGVGPLSWTRSE
jgi:hypothetical protein